MKALRITDWAEHYETNESRKLKELTWVKTPSGHDSLGYCEIISHPNGMSHYGAWNLILQLASKCPTRGLLVTGKGKAHDARSVALMTRASEKIIAEAIPRLISVGWLEEIELQKSAGTSGENPETSGDAAGKSVLEDKRGEERTEDERRGQAPVGAPGESPGSSPSSSLDMFDGVQPVRRVEPILTGKTWMDWKTTIGKRLGFNSNDATDATWAAIYNQAGWDEMTKAYRHLVAGLKKPNHKVWPSMFLALAKEDV